MYSQEEKNKMAMKNATIDKFSARQGCPDGQVSDGKGGCVSKKVMNLPEITVKPSKSQVENYTSKTDENTDAIKGDTKGMNKAVAIPNFSRIKGVDLEPSMDAERKARGYGAGYIYYRNRINEGTTSKSISEANAKRDAAKKENAAALLKFKSSKKKRGE